MTIVPIPLSNCASVVEFLVRGGKVEIPRPAQCLNDICRLKEPLRKNGSYTRAVIYWGFCFVVEIFRFRCRRCGKTASCPYGWLVPYCRFSAEVISAGIEAYATAWTSYREVSTSLCDLELVDPEIGVRLEDTQSKDEKVADAEEPEFRPSHTTVFRWVKSMCKHAETLLTQLQKEMVQEKKRGREPKLPDESFVENPNSSKAADEQKARNLDRLSFATSAADSLVGQSKQKWYRLRAYFLARAESRKDVLTETIVRLPITHTFELVIF